MTRPPTGNLHRIAGRLTLVLTRDYAAPIDDVWAAVTEPERMERWIGTWSGDPTSGSVRFRMTAEGEGVAEDEVQVRECDPPRRLAVTSRFGTAEWHLELDLAEVDGVTTLVFSQPDVDPDDAHSVGPGWEFYLDRLGAALDGTDVARFDFEADYFPAMSGYYRVP